MRRSDDGPCAVPIQSLYYAAASVVRDCLLNMCVCECVCVYVYIYTGYRNYKLFSINLPIAKLLHDIACPAITYEKWFLVT
jgi:hypothetical protein